MTVMKKREWEKKVYKEIKKEKKEKITFSLKVGFMITVQQGLSDTPFAFWSPDIIIIINHLKLIIDAKDLNKFLEFMKGNTSENQFITKQ